MTISPKSRFYSACLNLPSDQRGSLVRKAIAIACLRAFSNMELAIKSYLTFSSQENQLFDWDETTAGTIASRMVPATGKFPADIGQAVIDSGLLHPKFIKSTVIDIIYQDSHATNDLNNELVYLFGHQLEHLFDPLAEYSPEPTEMLYTPPSYPPILRPSDTEFVQKVCQELFTLQSNFTSDLLSMLQDFLIPLRVRVLGGELPGINMRTLNLIFPQTIDEIVRVNNILFEALNLAMPYGSYEVIKACGISIPYFYKACMRHEAATRNFAANLRENMEVLTSAGRTSGRFTVNRMESIIHCSLHLTKIKMVLDRLINIVDWREEELRNVDEFYQSAVGTIDSFGRETSVSPYDNRIFTSTGKLLVEISKGWPKELEYGWINRRVVTIFDAADVMKRDTVFNVVFIFTDSVVIVKPTEAVSMTSDSGIHKPSIADMLMHSMVNSMPLPNLPELQVVGWAPIEDVYMAEFGHAQNLAMYITGSGLSMGNKMSHLQIYKLIRPEVTAFSIVNYVSKAKIMNKTQPFHLFLNKQHDLSTFATVQEYRGYLNESRKCPIAVFAHMDIPESVLDTHDLIACIGTQAHSPSHISITVISKLAYKYNAIITKTDFPMVLSSQVSKLYSLYFASSNPFATEMIIQNNTALANNLIDYSTTRTPTPVARGKSHRLSKAKVTIEVPPAAELRRQPSLRERLSPVFSKLSRKVSTDLLRKNSDRRRSLLSLGKSSLVASRRPNASPSKMLSTISLPVQPVSAKPSVASLRHSYPSHVAQSKTYVTPPPVPTHLPPTHLSSSQQELVVQRRTSFPAVSNTSPPVRQVRNFHSQDVMGQRRRSSERYSIPPPAPPLVQEGYMETIASDSDGSRASSPSIGDITASQPATPNARSFTQSYDEYTNDDDDMSSAKSSVAKWFQELKRQRADSLESLDSFTAPQIDVNESTYDATEELTQSMKNLTRFIDKEAAHMSTPSLPLPVEPSTGSEPSVLLADDFAYLAGVVDESRGATAAAAAGLYPDIEDSSIVFLGNYIQSRDGSQLVLNRPSAESLGRAAVARHVQRHGSPVPPVPPVPAAVVSEHEWLSTTGSPSSASQVDQVAAYLSGTPSPLVSPSLGRLSVEPSYVTENMTVYSDASSNFSDADDDDSVVGEISRATGPGPGHENHQLRRREDRLPANLDAAGLKIRSLTVHLETLIHLESAMGGSVFVGDLEQVNVTVLRLFEGTRGLVSIPPSVGALSARDQARVVRVERHNRVLLMQGLVTLIQGQTNAGLTSGKEERLKERYDLVVREYLDLEWGRRDTMRAKMGAAMPLGMWDVTA